MGIEEHELIDSAMDRAMSKLETKDEPIEETTVETEIEPTEETKETLAKDRDEKGRFAKKQISDHEAKAESTLETDAQTEPTLAEADNTAQTNEAAEASQSVNPPVFWSTVHKGIFTKAAPELQKVIAERELEYQRTVSRLANESQRAKELETKLFDGWEDKRVELLKEGIRTPVELYQRFMEWDEIFRHNPKAAIKDLVFKNNLTPDDIFGADDALSNEHYSQVRTDPRVDEALNKVNEWEQKLAQQEQERERQYLINETENFKNSTDKYGNIRKPFAEAHAFQIDQMFQNIIQVHPSLSMQEALNFAYDEVMENQRKLFGVESVQKMNSQPQPKTKEQLIAQSQKAKAAASSISGSPTNATKTQKPRLQGNSFAERLDSAISIAERQHS